MKQTAKIRKYIALFFSGEVALFFASFISFPIFTRLLSKDDYGLMAIINLTLSFSITIGSAGLRDAVLRFFSFYKEKGREKNFYVTLVVGILLAGSLVAVVLLLLAGLLLFVRKIQLTSFYLLFFVIVILYFRLFNFLQRAFLRIQEKAKAAVTLDIVLRYGSVGLSIVGVLVWHNIMGFFGGILLAELAVMVFLLAKPVYRFSEGGFDRDILKVCLVFGLPLMVENLASYLLSGGDRYMISYFLGARQVANYSVAYNYCEYPLTIIRNALLYSFMPIIFNHWNADEKDDVRDGLNRYFKIYLWLAVPVVFGVTAVARHGVVFLAGEQYSGLTHLVPIIASGVVLNGMNFVISAGLILAKKTLVMLKITLVATLLNLALNIIAVPIFGLYGAAIATLWTYMVYFLLSIYLSQKEFKFPIPYGDIFKAVFSGFIMYVVIKVIPIRFLPILVGQILLGVLTYVLMVGFFWRAQLLLHLQKR